MVELVGPTVTRIKKCASGGSFQLSNCHLLYRSDVLLRNRRRITAPCGTGQLRTVNLHDLTGSRPFEYDGHEPNDDRDAATTAAISGDRNHLSTSCRDGSGSADAVESHGRSELPALSAISPEHSSGIITAGSGENNERPPINVLGLNLLQRGGRSPCSAFITLYRQYSTPCDMVAKVLSATFEESQSKTSLSTVTPRRSLFIGLRDIESDIVLSKSINIHRIVLSSIAFNAIGDSKHEQNKKQPISGSSVKRNGSREGPDIRRYLVYRRKNRGWKGSLHDRPDIVRDLGAYGRLQIGRYQESVQGVLSGCRGSILNISEEVPDG